MVPLFLVLSSCSTTKPMTVAKKYFKAIEAGDFETAKQYLTESSREAWDMQFELEAGGQKYSVQRVEEGDDGTTARVYYLSDLNSGERYIDLVKVDDQWLITLSSGDK